MLVEMKVDQLAASMVEWMVGHLVEHLAVMLEAQMVV